MRDFPVEDMETTSPNLHRSRRGLRRLGKRPKGLAIAILAFLCLACQADARPRTLDGDEAAALLSGNTVFGFDPRAESEFAMFHSSDGRIRARLRNAGGSEDESIGRWWITDEGRLCVDWENYRWVDSCAALVVDGESLTFVDDNGRIISFGEVAPGNPDDL